MSEKLNQKEIKLFASELLTKICNVNITELTDAFKGTENYRSIVKLKRNGKKRQLFAPPNELILIQKKLLKLFLSKFIDKSYPSGRPVLDPNLMGFISGRSHVQHSVVHTKIHGNFILKLDLKDAFPSVKAGNIFDLLYEIIRSETSLYKEGYEKRVNFFEIKEAGKIVASRIGQPPIDKNELNIWREKGLDILAELLPHNFRYKLSAWDAVVSTREFDWKKYYPLFPLFPNKKFARFRKLIREDDLYEDLSREVVKELVQQMVTLMTFQGQLPQGAPTSGLLFNLIVSKTRIIEAIIRFLVVNDLNYTLSIYADDLVIGFTKKPSKQIIESIIKIIYDSKIFRINSEKTKLYDRASIAPAITGFRLIRRPATEEEINNDIRTFVSGAVRRKKRGGDWIVDRISLPKKVQKKIRGLIHYATVNDVEDKVHSKINGYLGYVCQAYGNSFKNIPNQLSVPIQKYAQKYGKLKNFTD